jgi:hypothetical protein
MFHTLKPLPGVSVLTLVIACGNNDSDDDPPPPDPPAATILDLNDTQDANAVMRVFGSVGVGQFDGPVADGFDCDGDGANDFAMASMLASPEGRTEAGQVFLIFGDGTIGGRVDTAVANARVLPILGEGIQENTGSDIWMDDLTGDGLGDLIIGRQNYNAPGRIGAGAVSIVIGNAELVAIASRGESLHLAAPPAGINVITFIGNLTLDRLGMWLRTADASGDGIADLAVSADQADTAGETNSGTVYLIRGGAHLDSAMTIDLANFGASGLSGHIVKLNPPASASNYHFGSTLALGDLDGNGRTELYAAAALSRSGDTLMYSAASGDIDQNGFTDLLINEMRGNGVYASALDVGNPRVIPGNALPK